MKKLFQYIGCVLLAGLAMTACSPDEFSGADETKIPVVEGQDFTLTVDQDVNQITVSYPETPGVYPVWLFNGATYSTLNNAGWANAEAGTYTVEMRLGNRNGLSQGSIKKTFTFNETKVNYTNLLNRVAGKEWRIDYSEPAHLACGPYGGDGTGWWSAAPNEKKDFGVYDDRLTFTAESNKGGTFTYNPGADGMTYVNKGTTKWGSGDPDFDTPTQEQTTKFEFKRGTWIDSEGQEVPVDYLVLAPNTLFPYISSDAQYEDPRFRIETLTASKMVLVYEAPDKSISWRFILTSKGEEKKFEGFDANNDFNMWKGITPEMTFYYNPDPSWGNEQTPLFESLFEMGNNDYNVTVPSQCYADWQAQVHFHTNLSVNSATNYDFSVILNADKNVNDAIIKLTQDGDDGNFFFEEKVQLKAGEDYIFWKSDMPGIDANPIKLVIDFGHAGDDTHINIRNVVLKDHANDDGTVLPNTDEPVTPSVTWVAVDSPDNLGKDFNSIGTMEFWWADGGWSQIGNPQFSYENGVYVITASENGGSEWQAQCSIHNASVNIEAGQLYDVRAKIEASADLGRYTFKLCDEGDDDNTLVYNGGLSLVAGEQYVEFIGVKCQKNGGDSGFQTAKLFIDLGGAPVGFELRLSDIIVQKHDESGGVVSELDYDDADNLWKAVDDGSKFNAFGYYFADGGWAAIPYTEASHNGNSYEITLPEGLGGSQWQGQFHIDTNLTASGNKKYDFQVIMESDNDLPQVTFKLTDAGDSNFFFEERQDVPGGEPYAFIRKGVTLKNGEDATAIRMFFDFGGSPGGTNVKISKIVFREAK